MLTKLFGSIARVKLLKLFYSKVNEGYTAKFLSKKLNIPIMTIRRELDNLEKFGLIKTIKKENEEVELNEGKEKEEKEEKKKKNSSKEEKVYQIDGEFILFDEIKSVIVKAQILYERDFLEKINTAGKAKLLVFTGFFVNNKEAQIDLLIVGKFSKSKLLKFINELEIELNRDINYTIMDTKEFLYRRDITDVFLYQILDGKKLIVIDELSLTK